MTPWRKSSASYANGSCVEAAGNWRKSSASSYNGNCAEVGSGEGRVLIRDTQDRSGPVLVFPAAAWARFAAKVKSGT